MIIVCPWGGRNERERYFLQGFTVFNANERFVYILSFYINKIRPINPISVTVLVCSDQRRRKQSRAGGSILDKGTSPLLPSYLMLPLAKGGGNCPRCPGVPAPLALPVKKCKTVFRFKKSSKNAHIYFRTILKDMKN